MGTTATGMAARAAANCDASRSDKGSLAGSTAPACPSPAGGSVAAAAAAAGAASLAISVAACCCCCCRRWLAVLPACSASSPAEGEAGEKAPAPSALGEAEPEELACPAPPAAQVVLPQLLHAPLAPPLPAAEHASEQAQLQPPSLCMLWVLGMLSSWHSSSCQPKEGLLSGQTMSTGILGR